MTRRHSQDMETRRRPKGFALRLSQFVLLACVSIGLTLNRPIRVRGLQDTPINISGTWRGTYHVKDPGTGNDNPEKFTLTVQADQVTCSLRDDDNSDASKDCLVSRDTGKVVMTTNLVPSSSHVDFTGDLKDCVTISGRWKETTLGGSKTDEDVVLTREGSCPASGPTSSTLFHNGRTASDAMRAQPALECDSEVAVFQTIGDRSRCNLGGKGGSCATAVQGADLSVRAGVQRVVEGSRS